MINWQFYVATLAMLIILRITINHQRRTDTGLDLQPEEVYHVIKCHEYVNETGFIYSSFDVINTRDLLDRYTNSRPHSRETNNIIINIAYHPQY